jgi:hypothetical protein
LLPENLTARGLEAAALSRERLANLTALDGH